MSHKLNHDGYFRAYWGVASAGVPILEMFHRFIWRASHGEIPVGYEIDHKCKNRACGNVLHLQCISREQHLRETNETRYADIQETARQFYVKFPMTGTLLAKHFNVSFSTTCAWIRKWKKTTCPQTH